MNVYGHDPLLSTEELEAFGVKAFENFTVKVDCVIAAVAHEEFMNMDLKAVKEMLNNNPVLIDVRGMFEEVDARKKGFYYRRL